MRCTSYCTAESYHTHEWVGSSQYPQGRFIEKVYSVAIGQAYAFVFPYGCVAFWGMPSAEEERQFLATLKSFEEKPTSHTCFEESVFDYGDATEIHEEEDRIILESQDPLIKLSLSHALTQSVKLEVFERNINNTIVATRHLPHELATNGKISMSRHKMAQQIGHLVAERNSINLHSDILDQPEFFWKRPRYEPYYAMGAEYMDLSTRLDILNKKLMVVHELYTILSDELKHTHSSFLEMIIIGLIVVEVVLGVLRDVLKWI